MGFADALKNPLSWMRQEPAVFLLTVVSWIPGLLMLPVIFSILPTVQRLLAESNNDLTVLITQHGGELFQAILPLLIIGLLVLVVSALVKVFVSLALANAAAQLHHQRPLSLTDALAAAKSRFGTLVLAALVAIALLFAAVLALVLLIFVAIAALAIPMLGILITVVLGLLFLAAVVVVGVGSTALFLLLPVQVSQTQNGAWESVKNTLTFINHYKLQTAGVVLIMVLVQMVLGQIAMAGMPHLWLIILLSMVGELALFTWTNLFAAEFWFQYGVQPAPHAEKKTEPSGPMGAAEKTNPKKPDAPSKPKPAVKPVVRRTLKVGIEPKKTKK